MKNPLHDKKALNRYDQEAVDWVTLLNSGETSDQDFARFRVWYNSTPEAKQAFEKIGRTWIRMGAFEIHPLKNCIPGESIKTGSSQRVGRNRWAAIAATCVLALTFIFAQFGPPSIWKADYQTSKGSQYSLKLTDGSRIRLNTQTAIAKDFSGTRRVLELIQGEALFEVAKDPTRPFIVKVGKYEVRAVGTRFIVRKLKSGGRVIVTEGIVEAKLLNDPSRPVLLNAGQEVLFRDSNLGSAKKANLNQSTAWLKQQVIFLQTPLKKVVEEINRYREGKIFVLDAEISEIKVSGAFHLQNPDEILYAITDTFEIKSKSFWGGFVLLFQS